MKKFEHGHALLIGVGKHQAPGLINVPQTATDAQLIAEVLRNPQSAGYPADQVHLLTNQTATRAEVLKKLAHLAHVTRPDDTVFLFFSGHGTFGADGQTYYLITHDTRTATTTGPDGMKLTYACAGTGISHTELFEHLAAISAQRVLLFFNACFSGNLAPTNLSSSEASTTLGTMLPDETAYAFLHTGQGRAIVTAARAHQYSFLGSAGMTIFGEALAHALSGEDVQNHEGVITLFDLYAVLYRRVGAQTRPRIPLLNEHMRKHHRDDQQQPELTLLKNTGVIPVALYAGDKPPIAPGDPATLPPHTAARMVDAATAQQAYQHIMAVRESNFARNDVTMIADDQINAPGAQGFVNRPSGSVSQHFDNRTNSREVTFTSNATNYGQQVGVISVTNYHFTHERITQLVALHQQLRSFEGYIPRRKQEQQLSEKLKTYRGHQYVALHGMSGAGKTWLATHVINALQQEKVPVFPGGILWSSLSEMEPNHLLHYALGALPPPSDQQNVSYNRALREQFWYAVAQQKQAILIVFDDVKNDHQLMCLLPGETEHIPNCCILVICSTNTFISTTPDAQKERSIWLSGLSEPEEIMALFQWYLHLNPHEQEVYHEHISAIARHLSALPLLLTTAARDMHSRNIPPATYLRSLQEQHHTSRTLIQSIVDGLELVVRDLSDPQRRLFLFIGVFGQSSWTANMLAAVAVRRPDEMQPDLEMLIERGLVQPDTHDRYQVNMIVQEFARNLLDQQQSYIGRAACVCLAHYCLDLAHTMVLALRERPDMRVDPMSDRPLYTTSFVTTYRQRILPETRHIQRVLEWANREKNWSLLLRFADVAFAELFQHLVANSFEIRFQLNLATVVEPVVWQRGTRCEIGFETLISTERMQCVLPEQAKRTEQPSSSAWHITLDQAPRERPVCELDLDIRAGQVIDGLFEEMCFFDTEWLGVRATGLICYQVEFIGCVLAACDLSQSVWVACNARQIDMMGTNLSFALLRDSELYRANLADINLSGAVLEQVRLRGANLRNANFTGALLNKVDLRGADLRGACFRGAVLVAVNMRNCRVEDVDWNDVHITDFARGFECDEAVRHVIDRACATAKHPQHRWQAAREKLYLIQAMTESDKTLPQNRDLNGADLRALHDPDFHTATEGALIASQCSFHQADFRATRLNNADFSQADLRGANLRSVQLHGANVLKATLAHADMRTADLTAANLERADLTNARLRHACLRKAYLDNATMIEADLAYADVCHASLHKTNLQRATLRAAQLCGADLQGACLDQADCTEANFTEAKHLDYPMLARAAEWKGAILPDGRRVVELAGEYQGNDLILNDEDIWLYLAYLTGKFMQINLDKRNMCGARLSGNFVNVQFIAATMNYADLSGIFSNCDLSRAELRDAHISGSLHEVNFHGSVLDKAVLSGLFSNCIMEGVHFANVLLAGASLINCDLSNADISEEQLRQMKRLRGTILAKGQVYDGSFDLPGDLQDAAKLKYDLQVDTDRREFYKRGLINMRTR